MQLHFIENLLVFIDLNWENETSNWSRASERDRNLKFEFLRRWRSNAMQCINISLFLSVSTHILPPFRFISFFYWLDVSVCVICKYRYVCMSVIVSHNLCASVYACMHVCISFLTLPRALDYTKTKKWQVGQKLEANAIETHKIITANRCKLHRCNRKRRRRATTTTTTSKWKSVRWWSEVRRE